VGPRKARCGLGKGFESKALEGYVKAATKLQLTKKSFVPNKTKPSQSPRQTMRFPLSVASLARAFKKLSASHVIFDQP